VTWSSAAEAGSSSTSQGWTYQATSGGLPRAACIHSGPPAAVAMVSRSKAFRLQVSQAAGALSLVAAASGSTLWTPAGALPGGAPAQLCVTPAGKLQLAGASDRVLWTSAYPVPAASKGPFTAQVSDAGALQVLDASCALLYASAAAGGQAAGSKQGGGFPVGARIRLPIQVQASPAVRPLPPPPAAAHVAGHVRLPPAKSSGAAKAPGGGAGLVAVGGSKAAARPPPPRRSRPAAATGSPGSKAAAAALLAKTRRPPPAGVAASGALRSLPKRGEAGPSQLGAFPVATKAAEVSSSSSSSSSSSKGSCRLARGGLCGGINACGRDGPCAAKFGCCGGVLACRRLSAYTWACG
jgi:hypothetical protein